MKVFANIPERVVKTTVFEVIVILLIVLFLGTAADKWMDHEAFREGLRKSPFLTAYAGILSHAVPLAEVATVTLLLFKRTVLWGLYAAVFLMSAFTSYIYALLHYSYYVPCKCHAALESLTWEQHLLFNVIFLGLSTTGVILKSRELNQFKTRFS